MSEAKGKLLTCDRCGKTVFLNTVSESLLDGGFTKNTKFEDAPEGWEYHREPGTYGCHFCPGCNKAYKSILNDFMDVYDLLNSYHELEDELIILAGFNLSTLIDKLKAGYTIEPPKEDKRTPHLINYACSADWAQGMRDMHIINQGYNPVWIERYVPIQPSDAAYDNSSCKYCSNNPKNGGSGVCHCINGTPKLTW